MDVRKTGVAILAAAALAATAGTGAALTGGSESARPLEEASKADVAQVAEPAWLTSLMIRSEALNDEYEWLRVIMIRSEALNDKYAWLRALIARSEELNRQFGLGDYETAP